MKLSNFLNARPGLLPGLLFAAVLFGVCHPALAQVPDVTFGVTATSAAPGKAIPTLTWSSTTPAPTSCAATSGSLAWTGVKAASGSVVLPAITANANYVLACNWPADTQAVVSWNAITLNTDSTPLTDLVSYKVYYNTGDETLVTAPNAKIRSVPPAATPTTTITGLAPGPWFFTVTGVNAAGVEGPIGNIATKTIGAATVVTKNASVIFPGTAVVTVK